MYQPIFSLSLCIRKKNLNIKKNFFKLCSPILGICQTNWQLKRKLMISRSAYTKCIDIMTPSSVVFFIERDMFRDKRISIFLLRSNIFLPSFSILSYLRNVKISITQYHNYFSCYMIFFFLDIYIFNGKYILRLYFQCI